MLKPSPKMKTLFAIYYALFAIPYLLGVVVLVGLLAYMAEGARTALLGTLLALTPVLISAPVVAYWIRAFYDRARFSLTDNEIIVEKGVWWRRKDLVPYNRITNISVVQGPISRALGLATVRVQTAGFSGAASTGGPWPSQVAEAELFHVEDAEGLVKKIMGMVRRLRPVAVEAAPEEAPGVVVILRDVLAELKKIRELLEVRGS